MLVNCTAYDINFHKYELFLKHSPFCKDKLVRKYYNTKEQCESCRFDFYHSETCKDTRYGPFSVMMHDKYSANDCDSINPSIRRSQDSFGIDLTNASKYAFISIESPRIKTTTCKQLLSGGLSIYRSSIDFFENEGKFLIFNELNSITHDRCKKVEIFSPRGILVKQKMLVAYKMNVLRDTNWCEDTNKNMLLSGDDQNVLEYYLCDVFSSQSLVKREFSTVQKCENCASSLDESISLGGSVSASCYETENEKGFRVADTPFTFTEPYLNGCASDDTPFIIVPDWRLGLNLTSSSEFPYMLKRCALGTDWLGDSGPIFLHESQNFVADFSNTEYRHCGHDNLTLIDLNKTYRGHLICSHAGNYPASGIVTTTTAAPTTTTPHNETAEESLDTGQLAAGFIVPIALGLGVGALVIWEGVRRMRPVYTALRGVQSKAAWRIA